MPYQPQLQKIATSRNVARAVVAIHEGRLDPHEIDHMTRDGLEIVSLAISACRLHPLETQVESALREAFERLSPD